MMIKRPRIAHVQMNTCASRLLSASGRMSSHEQLIRTIAASFVLSQLQESGGHAFRSRPSRGLRPEMGPAGAGVACARWGLLFGGRLRGAGQVSRVCVKSIG